jgi:hypothetical protein
MTLTDAQPLDGVYIDYMSLTTTMTHLFSRAKLNRRFEWYLSPNNFFNTYHDCVTLSARTSWSPMVIHNLGQLRSLTNYEIRNNHFWSNLVNKDIDQYLLQMQANGAFPYLPFIINPNLKISVNKAILDKYHIEYFHLTTEIHLFPQSVAVIHIRVYLKAPLTISTLVDVQREFSNQRIFYLSQSTAKKMSLETSRSYDLQYIFSSIARCIRKTLYIDEPETIDKSTPQVMHRVVNPLGSFNLTDAGTVAVLSLSKNPKENEVKDIIESKLNKKKDPSDVIAFSHGATLLYTPKNNQREIDCLRNNYTHAVELVLLQSFFLSAIIDRLDREATRYLLERTRDLGELGDSAIKAIIPSFKPTRQCLLGGHRRLLKLISKKTGIELKEGMLFMSYQDIVIAQSVIDDMKEPQTTLEAMIQKSYDNKFEGGILDFAKITTVQTLGAGIINQIELCIQGIQQEKLKSFPSVANLAQWRDGMGIQFNVYKTNYLPQYKTLVEKLVAEKDKIEKNVDAKRQAGEKVPDADKVKELLKSATDKTAEAKKIETDLTKEEPNKPKSFLEKAKPYIGLIGGAAMSVLKALGYMPV